MKKLSTAAPNVVICLYNEDTYFNQMNNEPAKYKIDKELFEKFRKKFEKGNKPIIRNLLSKSPEFINNLLK